MNDVCFATVDEFGSCIIACQNAAAVLGGTCAVIPEHGETPAAVLQAGLLVLSAWSERYEPILKERRGPIIPRWHSTVLQTELAQETPQLARIVALLDEGRFPAMIVNDIEFLKALGRRGMVFLPDVLDQSEYRGVTPMPLIGINISLFGAAHSRKNIIAQSAAFDRARREIGATRWTLHLNGQTVRDPAYDLWLKSAKIPFVEHGRLERSRYLGFVAAMEAGLCATLSESYCYVAADHVALGVPVVASPTIVCLGNGFDRVRPDSIDEIAGALTRAIVQRDAIGRQQRRSLDEQARINARIGQAVLLQLINRAERSSR